ncbi:MAG: hypothetical protein WBQ73_03795 [Candidatus Babeliales bacterium]
MASEATKLFSICIAFCSLSVEALEVTKIPAQNYSTNYVYNGFPSECQKYIKIGAAVSGMIITAYSIAKYYERKKLIGKFREKIDNFELNCNFGLDANGRLIKTKNFAVSVKDSTDKVGGSDWKYKVKDSVYKRFCLYI